MTGRPLYAELAAELIREINSGRYPVGSLLPTEMELAAAHGISRSTARAALNNLHSLGLVTRHKGIGTRVAPARGPQDYTASATTLDELIHFGEATIRTVHEIEPLVADTTLAEKLDGRLGKRWIRFGVTRSESEKNDLPICWTDNYLDGSFADVVDRVASYPGLIVRLVEEMYGVTVDEVSQLIMAVVVDDEMAEILQCQPKEPALRIIRRYRGANGVYHISISTHPADRFAYAMNLVRSRPQNLRISVTQRR